MKIKHVKYQRSWNTGRSKNRIELTAEVDENEEPIVVLDQLEGIIDLCQQSWGGGK